MRASRSAHRSHQHQHQHQHQHRSDAANPPPYHPPKMYKFSTVKKACDFLSHKTQKRWDSKFEIVNGKRFYFVWRADFLPLNQCHWGLVCRGDKEQILAKLERFANSPVLPSFV
jgi:hypothetical protein